MFEKFSSFQYDLKKLLYRAIISEGDARSQLLDTLGGELLHEETVTRWTSDRGDFVHRLVYPLGPDSVVFDVGGFRGEWASSIYCLYGCNIHIFEPMPGYVDFIQQKFGRNPKIKVHDFGLAQNTGTIEFNYLEDATTQFRESERKIEGKIMDVNAFLDESGIGRIDLMKLNVEGAEYSILERLLDSGYVSRIDNLQIQFHNFVPGAQQRRKTIQDRLSATYNQTYNYDFVWEGWTRK